MPPEKGGTNRFAALEDESIISTKAKRRKTSRQNLDFFGPTPSEVTNIHSLGSDPKYMLLQTVESNKKITSLNPFLIKKTLEGITTHIKTFKPTREGQYLILLPNATEAEKVRARFTEVLGNKVKAEFHARLNSSKGTIRAPALKFLSEEELLEGLKEENPSITEAKHVTKRNTNSETNDGQQQQFYNTGFIRVTFSTLTPPKNIKVLYEKIEVTRWYPSPLRCRNCYNFRHHESRCQQTPKCPRCNRACAKNDANHVCDRIYCIGCDVEGDHVTFDRNCPAYGREKEIVKLQIDLNITRYEARQKWYDAHRATPVNNSQVRTVATNNITNPPNVVQVVSYAQTLKSPNRPTSPQETNSNPVKTQLPTNSKNTQKIIHNNKTNNTTDKKQITENNKNTNSSKQQIKNKQHNNNETQTLDNTNSNISNTLNKNTQRTTNKAQQKTNCNNVEEIMDVEVEAQVLAASKTPLPTGNNNIDIDDEFFAYFDSVTGQEDDETSNEESA